ncbi:hypothetical protein ACFQZE_15950 [Paenibacillus sp. GCM10027627]|uniref:hypothetical protein n=1 Tax=unclassified Paenibacillus TaxID=185978 RepID=UPI00363B0327
MKKVRGESGNSLSVRHRAVLLSLIVLLVIVGVIGRNAAAVQAAYDGPISQVVVIAKTELYHDTSGKGKPAGAVAPFQTLQVVGVDNENDWSAPLKWLKVKTWLGDKWIKSSNIVINGQFKVTNRQVTSVYEVQLYDKPDLNTNINKWVSPQKLRVTGQIAYGPSSFGSAAGFLNSYGTWFRISTWLGDKWIHNPSLLEDVVETPVSYTIKLTGEENTYPFPYIVESKAQKIMPQAVRVLATWETGFGPSSALWYKVKLEDGIRWVYPSSPIIPDYSVVNERIVLPTDTRYFSSPQLSLDEQNWLAPGSYEAFEISGEWRHIRLPQGGEAWVNPARALLERPEGIVETEDKVALTKESTTYRYPLTGEVAHAKGFYKPQTVQAFEKWTAPDGTVWYHFHGYGIDEWVSVSAQ